MEKTESPALDPVHDILRYERHPLDVIFAPTNVAVIGASEKPGSVGRTVLWNLISNPFGGTVFPVNPKRPGVLGIKAYPTIADIPAKVDLAVICTPAPAVPGLIAECVDAGIKGAVVISAGFKEMGAPGIELERQIMEHARRGGMRIIGPNCLGIMNPLRGLNATFANSMARPGNVAFISQSGALCTAVLDWSHTQMVGFSAFVSIGSMVDVNWGDLIDYFGNDPKTQSIVIYMESIGDARSFLSAAREVALTKPIIVIKAGRTAAAAKAAASHTGSLTGSDDVLQAAFRRCGVLRVDSIDDLFSMAQVLAKQPRPQGPNLTILTNAGGPGVLATDALITGGGEMTELSPQTHEELDKLLPVHWSHNNPIDVLGDADPERYAKSLEIAARDPNSDGMLVILTPQDMTDPTKTAEALKAAAANTQGKPVLASWMGGDTVAAGESILNQADIPTFPYPDKAAQTFNYMWRSTYNLRGLYETPMPSADTEDAIKARERAAAILKTARDQGRTILTEFESKELLSEYGIPTVKTVIARTEAEAVQAAESMGYPVVLKLFSETITHKTDVGGVQLNLGSAEAVSRAWNAIQTSVSEKVGAEHFLGVTVQEMIKLEGYELIIGASADAQFGPVLLFGSGGQLVEVMKDSSLGLPPLNTTLARRMVEQTKIFKALKGVRGRKPVNIDALEKLLVQFSNLVVEHPWIKEIDINPLLASPERLVALDARVVVYGAEMTEEKLPKAAIRPYPTQYVTPWRMRDGSNAIIRPIKPEDEPLVARFHESLSDRSVIHRFRESLNLSQRTAHERLVRICFNDYDREIALVVDHKNGGEQREILGVGRLSRQRYGGGAEFTLLIADEYQGQGLGTRLMGLLLEVGRAEGMKFIEGAFLPASEDMITICKNLGFTMTPSADGSLIHARVNL